MLVVDFLTLTVVTVLSLVHRFPKLIQETKIAYGKLSLGINFVSL